MNVCGESHDVVETCWVGVDVDDAKHRRYVALLSSAELARAASFRGSSARLRFLNRRGALREALSFRLGCRARDIEYRLNQFGKPSVRSAEWCQFCAAHSAGVALFAFTDRRPVGCDIERFDPLFPGLEVADAYFTVSETSALRSLPDEARAAAFFQTWTRKEAFVKATGEGLSRALDSFTVLDDPPSISPAWSGRSFKPVPGYHAAVVTTSEEWRHVEFGEECGIGEKFWVSLAPGHPLTNGMPTAARADVDPCNVIIDAGRPPPLVK